MPTRWQSHDIATFRIYCNVPACVRRSLARSTQTQNDMHALYKTYTYNLCVPSDLLLATPGGHALQAYPHMIYVCRMPICSPIDTAKYVDIEHREHKAHSKHLHTHTHTSTRHVQHNMTLCTLCKRHVAPAFYTIYIFLFLSSSPFVRSRIVSFCFKLKNQIDCVRDAICKRQSPAKIV